MSNNSSPSLWSLFWIFLRIAATSFGGFMAMISVVQNAIVDRRKLLSQQDMLDGISLASILPGPIAMNVVAYVGYRLRGPVGAFVSAFAAVLPAFILIVILSVAYFRWGQVPAVSKIFMGFVPAVAAIIAAAAWNMARKSIVDVRGAVIAIAAAAALLGIGGSFITLGIIAVAGFIGWWFFSAAPTAQPSKASTAASAAGASSTSGNQKKSRRQRKRSRMNANALLFMQAPVMVAPLTMLDPSLVMKVFVTFAGMSLFLFGGAYVFIPLIQQIVVDGHGWVTHQEFVDAVALSQLMPGPVLVSAAFVGLKVAGVAGAVAATLGIFAPSAVVMVICSHLLEKIKHSAVVKAALQGIRPAVVGMIAGAAIMIAKSAPMGWVSAVIFIAALIALLRFRVEAMWTIPVAGLVGYLAY